VKRLILAALACTAFSDLYATQVVDTFETDNPNQWGWTNKDGGFYLLQPTGGNPGGWLDSDVAYRTDHPNLTSVPADNTALKTALASGELVSAGFDFQRLDAGTCLPQYDLPSTFALEFIDLHSDPGGSVIEAHVNGDDSPTAVSSWQTVTFSIPSSATDVPDGWLLNAPPELNYTWQDMMHNIDGIRFFSISPDDITYSSCWRLGADNVIVTYGDDVFADGFEGVVN
jgi:hypothetical protein